MMNKKHMYEALSFYMDGKERKVMTKYGIRENGKSIKKAACIDLEDIKLTDEQKTALFDIWDSVINQLEK